jgi:flagellar basal-body rod protein FlgF
LKNIWVPLSGQIAQQRKVETIANNIANANTTGFKREEVVFKEHLTALTEKGGEDIHLPNKEFSPEDFYHTQGQENAMVKVDGNFTDFTQGTLNPTNNPLDLALFGEGFYEVLTPYGVRFTRKGHFSISKDGEIVNDRGFKLLSAQVDNSQGGDGSTSNIEERVLKLPPGIKKLSISKEGEIFTENGLIGNISVVEFKDPHALRKQGNSLYANPYKENTYVQAKKTAVHQGFVEGSNVNAVKEMAELIKANRHFENIQKAISTYDNISGRAVNDISKF